MVIISFYAEDMIQTNLALLNISPDEVILYKNGVLDYLYRKYPSHFNNS